ncbi:sigma-70 family RNA polymerase sigma factor [Nocardia sp. NPDC052566]|uniref:sigma-70 family RNA polymerase sigma factor n=1 Tax=Nocardia sp. NPDC052566 TaxID=3364330 RepID=UPI0037C51265
MELLAAVAAKDRDAFTEFYRDTSHRVFGLAVHILRNRLMAEEITQEVYLQVWTTADRYNKTMSSPLGWLLMLTHRRAVDRVRAEQAAASRDTVWGYTSVGIDCDTVVEEVDQHLDEQAVTASLSVLTAIQREAIALVYYGGRTYPEAAAYLGVPLPTVKSRIRGGLKRLQTCLTQM